MRARLVLELTATAIALVAASCSFPDSHSSTCDDDPSLCPQSVTSATSVTCDCKCTLGLSEDTGDNFNGHIDMCLPPELNTMIASDEQRVALHTMDARTFDQRVFQYCSRDVASFLRSAIRLPARIVLACAVPVACECSTRGTSRDTDLCHSGCKEVACDAHNCPAVLRTNATVDLATCFCSRSTTCGAVTPSEGQPGVCHDWTSAPPTEAELTGTL